MAAEYYTGDLVRLEAQFRDFDGVLVDPTTVTARTRTPAAVIVESLYPDAGWTRAATGIFYFDVPVPESGTWRFSFEGTGAVQKFAAGTFRVLERTF